MPADAAPIVRRGHLRVDFTKGAHKLSRHLLVDPSTYLLELVRVAILSGATRADIEYDANDVVIEFDGRSFEYAEVEDLFTRVVSESFDKRLYLLAVAVGAALTVSDGTVTVFGHQRDGTTHSTTYDNDAPGRATPGGKLPMKRRSYGGTLIHVRRSFGLEVAKAAITHGEPREVKLTRQRAARAPLAIFIRKQRASALDALLRVELGSNLGIDVAVEIVPVRKSPPTLLFAELGIPVVESTWVPVPWMHSALGTVPIVVRADSPSLPLNASRSQVQEDVEKQTREFAAQGLSKLADAIRNRLDSGALDVQTEDAIGTIAAGVRGTHDSCFSFLLDRPLLRDGFGRGVSLRELDAGERFGFFIRGDHPLPPDHEHVARDVLWLRGRAVEAAVLDKRLPFGTVSAQVKAGVKRRNRVLRMPTEMPTVDPAGAIAIRKIESSDGIRGELALRDPATRDPRALATVCVYIEGHPIKKVTLDANDGWLPYDAAIAWDGHLEPTLAYDDLRRSPAGGAITRLLVEEAGRALLEAVDAAGRNASNALRALALRGLERVPDSPALRAVPVFSTVVGRFVALDAIVAMARADGAICYAARTPPPDAAAPDGRDVLVLTEVAASIVARAIAPARILRYDEFLRPQALSNEAAFASICQERRITPPFVVRDGNAQRSAMVGLAPKTVVARFHAGHLVALFGVEGGLGMVMVTDEPSAFPDVERQTVDPRIDDWVTEMQSRLVEATMKAAMEGSPQVDAAVFLASLAPSICELVANGTVAESAYSTLRQAPMFRMLDKEGAPRHVNAIQIVDAHPGHRPIPFLERAPTFSVTDWRVVIAPETHAIDALTKLLRRSFFKATIELHHRERAAEAATHREDVMKKARFLGAPPELHPLSPIVELRGEGFLLTAAIRRNVRDERTRATVLYDGREVSHADFESPVASLTVLADFSGHDRFNDVAALVEPRRSALGRALEAAIPELARAVVATDGGAILQDVVILRFLAKASPLTTGLFDGAVADVPTVSGGCAPLREVLSRAKSKRLFVGRRLEVPWPVSDVPTSLDEPILFAPNGDVGDALLAVLRDAGFIIDDMTQVIAEEAAKRRGEPPPPRQASPSVPTPRMPAASLPPREPPHATPSATTFDVPAPAFAPAPPKDAAPAAPPPTDPVEDALRALLKTTGKFTSPPHPAIRYTPVSRPIRYRPDANGGTLEIGAGAKSIEVLLARRDAITLATGALSEINRELVEVTDQEEVNALLFLLKSL